MDQNSEIADVENAIVQLATVLEAQFGPIDFRARHNPAGNRTLLVIEVERGVTSYFEIKLEH